MLAYNDAGMPVRKEMSGGNPEKISDGLYAAFIGPRAPYYMARFDKFNLVGGNFILTWNWAGFLFPQIWLFYRKMYLYGLIVLLASFVIPAAGWFFSGLVVGICGNYAYFTHAASKLQNLQNAFVLQENLLPAAKLLGGTHWILALIVVIIYTVTLIMLGMLVSLPFGMLGPFGTAV